MSETYAREVKGSAWTWLCGRCATSSLNCFLEAGVSQRAAGVSVSPPPFLSDAHSLLPRLWVVTRGAQTDVCFFRTRSQLSLFTAGLLCAFSVHMVWWEFHLLCGNLQTANHLGNREQNWCFPSSPGLIGGWQRWAPNLRWRNSRTYLYWALSPRGQSWSRPCIGNFHTSVWLFLQKQT